MKKGLVVEGGGMRAIFICGCLDALLDYNVEVDYFIGVSAGIANGASFISKQKGRNLQIVNDYVNDPRYMGYRNLLSPKNKSYFGIDFTFRVIPKVLLPFDYETFHQFKGPAIAVVSNVDTGEAEYVNLVNNPLSEEYLIASCSLPVMFPVKTIRGRRYLDGGICDPIPIRKAIEDGCDKILVLLTREKGYRKSQESMEKTAVKLFKKNKKFVSAIVRRPKIYNFSNEVVNRLEELGRIKVIRPISSKNFSRIEKDVDKMKAFYQQGYDAVAGRIEEIRAYFADEKAEQIG